MLKLNTRWGLSRIEIEQVLFEHGLEILDELQLDVEKFRIQRKRMMDWQKQ